MNGEIFYKLTINRAFERSTCQLFDGSPITISLNHKSSQISWWHCSLLTTKHGQLLLSPSTFYFKHFLRNVFLFFFHKVLNRFLPVAPHNLSTTWTLNLNPLVTSLYPYPLPQLCFLLRSRLDNHFTFSYTYLLLV